MIILRIGSSIALIAIGAILAFAVADVVDFVDLVMVGWILMVLGVIGLITSIILNVANSSKKRRVTESRSVVDPNTGEKITRNESVDNGGPDTRV